MAISILGCKDKSNQNLKFVNSDNMSRSIDVACPVVTWVNVGRHIAKYLHALCSGTPKSIMTLVEWDSVDIEPMGNFNSYIVLRMQTKDQLI